MIAATRDVLEVLTSEGEALTAGEIAAHLYPPPKNPPVPAPVPGDFTASSRNRSAWLEAMRLHKAALNEHERVTSRAVYRALDTLTGAGLVERSTGPRVASWAVDRVELYGGGTAGASRLLRSVLGLDIVDPEPVNDTPWTESPERPPDVPGLVGLLLRIHHERPASRAALFPRENGSDERKLSTLVAAGLVLLSGQRVATEKGRELVASWSVRGAA